MTALDRLRIALRQVDRASDHSETLRLVRRYVDATAAGPVRASKLLALLWPDLDLRTRSHRATRLRARVNAAADRAGLALRLHADSHVAWSIGDLSDAMAERTSCVPRRND